MSIDRFVNIIAATVGFAGAIFLLKGVLHLAPDLIAKLSQTHWDFSVTQLQNLASQKADIVSGAFLVSLAFLIQMIGLLLIRESFSVFEGHWFAATMAVAASLLIIAIFIAINKGLTTQYEQQSKAALVKSALENAAQDGVVGAVELKSIEQYAQLLLGINRMNESADAFIRTLAGKVGASLPPALKVNEEPSVK